MRHDRAMPDAGMDVEPGLAIASEADELLGRDVIARRCQRHDKAFAVEWIKQLAAVGMIVRTPDQRAFAGRGWAIRSRRFRPGAPGEEIAVADRVVARIERLALPPEFKKPLGNTALV